MEYMTLEVTGEQKRAIEELFEKNKWELVITSTATHTENVDKDRDTSSCTAEDFDPENQKPGYVIEHDESESECPFCLCRPCITSEKNKQSWWPTMPSAPHRLNSQSRKTCYNKFWTMMFHRGVWQDRRYKQRKSVALGLDPTNNQYVWLHKRDLMPDCIIKLVREWYPNPTSVPYMGHLWQ
jgi:hypothetical protein